MSRIIVKNLPKSISSKKLEELFSTKGIVTDLQLKYNKEGIFRQFAFIGYKTEEEANAAKEYFHNTFVNTSKISVEICHNLGDVEKPKPWNKSIESIDSVKHDQLKVKSKSEKKKKLESLTEKVQSERSKKKINDVPEELKDDPEFKEFLRINERRTSKPVWAEDIDVDSDSEIEDNDTKDSDGSESNEEIGDSSVVENIQDEKGKLNTTAKEFDDSFTVKLRNLPYHCKKAQIKKFLHPLKITSLRLPPKQKGFAYVKFKTEKDLKKALIKHRGFLDGHRIDVVKYVKKENENNVSNNKNSNKDDKELNEDLLAETGRIYIRNLCFSVTEDDIKELFSKFGPSEVHVPIDFTTKKSKGFAFVTFMFAEHAVKAFTELDGKIFQGRVLHLIPAQPKREYQIDENETNYKKKKEAKKKKESGSSHNWNILFLGMNAVADVIAEKYGIKKSSLLSGEARNNSGEKDATSLPVRMALAETEVVENTRKFLIENGVQLDAFSQPAAERSKTVIVVKHLPAKTSAAEINDLFAKHGTISRTLVPPTGVVALVEFDNPNEAKTAFTKLAYRRFRNEPLFLEWAPVGGLIKPQVKDKENDDNSEKNKNNEEESHLPNEDISPETGTTIYVKNINFDTKQTDFEKHFQQCGPILNATISTRKDPKKGRTLSMGFGFVQFAKKEGAIFALQNLQQSMLDGYALELKFANRIVKWSSILQRKKYEVKKQTSSKILVRNIPFQASLKEVKELFKGFGDLKNVRLPKKLGKTKEHRGFGFIEYTNLEDAQRAFEALCHSTHLYNRRLVLEWANPEADSIAELRKKTAENYVENRPKKKMKKSQLKEDVLLAAARHGTQQKDE